MKTIIKIIIILAAVFLIFLSCTEQPTEPEYDNPLDEENPYTGGDPFNLTAEIAEGGIRLTWEVLEIEEIFLYNIYRSVDEGDSVVIQEIPADSAAVYVDQDVINGHRYRYFVAAFDQNSIQINSKITEVVINNTPLISIDDEGGYTPTRIVNLTVLAFGAEAMRMGAPELVQTQWITYSSQAEIELPTGEGIKVVQAQFAYPGGDTSEVVSDTTQPLPMNPNFNIAHDSVYTAAKDIWIFPQAEGVNIECMFSEDSTFAEAEWIDLQDSVAFTLSSGPGTKTVFGKFSNDFMIESPLISDEISPLPMNPEFNLNHDSVYTAVTDIWIFPQAEGINIKCIFSEDSTLAEAEWLNLADSLTFTLSSGPGAKTVFGKFRNDFAIESTKITDDILPLPVVVEFYILPDSEYINTNIVTLSAEGSGALEMKFSLTGDSSGIPWLDYSPSVENFILESGDGLKSVYGWFRNDFITINVQDEIYLDTYCEIADFSWSPTNIDTFSAGDILHFEVLMSDDNLGFETGGIASVSLPGAFENLALQDNGNGIYSLYYAIEAGAFVMGGYITANFSDRAGNIADPFENENPINIKTHWELIYDGGADETCPNLTQVNDGGFVAVGGSGGAVYILKTDAAGNVVFFNVAFSAPASSFGYDVCQSIDGGYAIAGYVGELPDIDLLLIKTDASGNGVWVQTYGGSFADYGYGIVSAEDGGYVICGSTKSYGAGNSDTWLLKTDAGGNIEWSRTFGGSNFEAGYEVIATVDGGYAVIGYTGTSSNSYIRLIKTDSAGNLEWNQSYSGSMNSVGRSLKQTNDGGYIVAGYALQGNYDIKLIKTDSGGGLVWSQQFGYNQNDYAYSVDITPEGGYIIAGYTIPVGMSENDMWLIRTDGLGGLIWDEYYGGSGDDRAYTVEATEDGGYIIGGITDSYGGGDDDIYLRKLPPGN